jgi:hypothetical protein
LCHLGKFVCSPHYLEQVGFFSSFRSALDHPAWRALELELDANFERDRDHVAADMNGSCVFLFAVLKMKLKMAARRALARRQGSIPPSGGPLSADEYDLFRDLFDRALDAFRLEGPIRTAAVRTSARRDAPEMAARLTEHFRNVGVLVSARGAEAASVLSPRNADLHSWSHRARRA